MFTGIIEELGKVRSIVHGSSSIRLEIECFKILEDAKLGDSIAVNGICLTVTDLGDSWFTADVMPETMRRTSLSALKPSQQVNLERALRLSDRIGGHMVSGHIDGTGTISNIKEDDNAIWLTVAAGEAILKYIVMKGSVALDGTSLTVAYADDGCFRVSLIPLTARSTILGFKRMGDIVNIECDVVGKYIEKLLAVNTQERSVIRGVSMEMLRENGFA